VKVIINLHLVPMLRMSGAGILLPIHLNGVHGDRRARLLITTSISFIQVALSWELVCG
jgi:hypothetical protein